MAGIPEVHLHEQVFDLVNPSVAGRDPGVPPNSAWSGGLTEQFCVPREVLSSQAETNGIHILARAD